MKIAIVHEWLATHAGNENVLECYPQADLFSLVDFLARDQRGFISRNPRPPA